MQKISKGIDPVTHSPSRRSFLVTVPALAAGIAACTQAEPSPAASQQRFSVLDYGAVADGQTLNTAAIQNTIDAAASQGGGIVVVPKGRYVTGTILLRDNIELSLEKGSELLGSNNLEDYQNIDAFRDGVNQERGACLIGAKDVKGVAITGDGAINGRGERMVYKNPEDRNRRPFLIRFVRCENVVMDGVSTRNSAAWNIHVYQSNQVQLTNLRILSQSEGNGDGIDLDSSQNVLIADCDINAHDDAIALKSTSPTACRHVRIRHCRLSSRWGAVKFGTETLGDFEDIEISDCYMYDVHGGGIKINSVDGANIRNITIRDIEMNNVEMPVFIRLGARLKSYRDLSNSTPGSIDSITIRNIQVHGKRHKDWRITPPGTIFITGIKDARIKNVHIEGIDALMYSSGSANDAQRQLPEKREDYPEFTRFGGHLPAYGAYIRHAENVTLKDIQIVSRKKEQRHFAKALDVKNLTMEDIKMHVSDGAVQPFSFEQETSAQIKDISNAGTYAETWAVSDATSHIKIEP